MKLCFLSNAVLNIEMIYVTYKRIGSKNLTKKEHTKTR